MTHLERETDGNHMFTLPATLDLTTCPTLKTELLAALALGEGVEIDASKVQRVTSPCFQVLVAAARDFAQAGGPAMRLSQPSDALSQAAALLALSAELGLPGAAHV